MNEVSTRSSPWITLATKALVPGISVLLLGGSLYLIPLLAPAPGGFYYDANDYVRLAREIAENGLWGGYKHMHLRTYLYPLLLSLFPAVLQDESAYMALYAKWILLPYAAIAICTWVLFKRGAVHSYSLLWAAILANPLLLVYIPVTLTESCFLLTFALLLGLIAFFARPTRSTTAPSILQVPLIMMIGLLAGALSVIRPAGVPVSAAAVLAVLHTTLRSQGRPRLLAAAVRSTSTIASVALLFGCGFFVAAFPQIVLNVKHFDQFSILPLYGVATDRSLDTLQFGLGLENFKYTTLVSPGAVRPNGYYPTAGLVGNVEAYNQAPLTYYRDHFWTGMVLLITHVYQSVNYDFLEVYVPVTDYAILSWHQLLSSLVTVFGLFGVGYAFRQFRTEILADPVQAFLLLVLFAVSALNSLTAIETRYGMLATAVLSYFALRFLWCVAPALNRRQQTDVAVVVLAYLGLSAWASKEFVELIGAFKIVWI